MAITKTKQNPAGYVNDPKIKAVYTVPYAMLDNSRYKHIDEVELVNGKSVKAIMAKKDISILSNTPAPYIVTLADEHRIDLVAYKLYGASSLYWVLCYYNNITDPLNLPIGTELIYPPLSSLRDFPNPLS